MATESPITDEDWKGEKLPGMQEKFLDRFAQVMPWYVSAPIHPDSPSTDAFCQWMYLRMMNVLKFRDAAEVRTQDLSSKRRLLRHVSYKLLLESMYCFTNACTPEQVVSAMRHILDCTIVGGVIPVNHSHHPLSAETHRLKQTRHGAVIEATVPDVKLASWIKHKGLEVLIQNLPEITVSSSDVRLDFFQPELRSRLKKLMDSPLPSDEIRSTASGMVGKHWADAAEETGLLQEAERVADLHNLSHLLLPQNAEEYKRLQFDQFLTSPAREQEFSPLLQIVALNMSEDGATDALITLANAWSAALERFKVAPCHRPESVLPILSAHIKDVNKPLEQIKNLL